MIIKEDNKSTLQANRVAVTVYNQFISFLKRLPSTRVDVAPFTHTKFYGSNGYILKASMFAPDSPLDYLILLPKHPQRLASFNVAIRGSGAISTILALNVLGQRSVLNLSLLASREMKEYFVHEYIHCLDYYREKSLVQPVVVNDEDEDMLRQYYNSPKEFNAYFHEGLTRIHNNILSVAKHKHQATWFRVFPTFSKFLTEIIYNFDSGFIEALDSKYRRKFIKRLHQYYDFIADKWRNYRA
jgi:hypothetical protein